MADQRDITDNRDKRGGFRKLADIKSVCAHPEHNPPKNVVLEPGSWEYTCPACGSKKKILIPRVIG